MSTKLRQSHHFNAYYHNNSLLIQFVLTEFVHTHRIVNQIQERARNHLNSQDNLESAVFLLFSSISQLLGSVSDPAKVSISHWTKGPLTKLREYCEQFSHNELHTDQKGILLHQYVHQAWLSALHSLDLLNQLQQSSSTALTLCRAVKRGLNQLDRRFKRISRLLPRVIKSYQDNENVLFFLLRKKGLLSQVYGPHFMHEIFKIASKKHEDLISLLTHRYTERGFHHVLPLISAQY